MHICGKYDIIYVVKRIIMTFNVSSVFENHVNSNAITYFSKDTDKKLHHKNVDTYIDLTEDEVRSILSYILDINPSEPEPSFEGLELPKEIRDRITRKYKFRLSKYNFILNDFNSFISSDVLMKEYEIDDETDKETENGLPVDVISNKLVIQRN